MAGESDTNVLEPTAKIATARSGKNQEIEQPDLPLETPAAQGRARRARVQRPGFWPTTNDACDCAGLKESGGCCTVSWEGSSALVWDAERLRIAADAAEVALWSWNVDTGEVAPWTSAHAACGACPG